MSSSRNSKSKSSGLRILWIPGGRKNHGAKGRFDSTNKQIAYSPKQKKSEVWSLGGSKAQKDLLNADPETALFDGPSGSGLAPITCAVGAAGVAGSCAASSEASHTTTTTAEIAPALTPNSTTSTTPLPSVPQSPVSTTTPAAAAATITTTTTTLALDEMPSSKYPPSTTVTTAEIIEENRFTILDEDANEPFSVYDLPVLGKHDTATMAASDKRTLNTSGGTTASTASTTPTPATSPKSETNSDKGGESPKRKKHKNQKHDNNSQQGDINSIENISDPSRIPSGDLDWIDELMARQNGGTHNILLEAGASKTKKKSKLAATKQLDQLDGVPHKMGTLDSTASTEDDEKMVKCLYYTLMCCECTIS